MEAGGGEAMSGRMQFRVLRMDDHGNRFELARTATLDEASALVAEYTRRGHKQIYWVEEIAASAPAPA
jgi:hypothetical protein